MVAHENKFNQLEEEKVQLRNEMVQKTTLIFFQLDRQKLYIRKNILIYGVGEDKEDNNDGQKVLFKIADGLEIDLQDNDIQRVHRLEQKKKQGESTSNHCKICVIQKKKRVSY